MALTCGFYNSVQGDRKYSAEQISSIFDGLISDGVYSGVGKTFLVTTENLADTAALKVLSGRAWFNHTWTLIDANGFNISKTEVFKHLPMVYDRYITVALQINTINRENTIVLIAGEEADTPEPPEIKSENGIYVYPLANVRLSSDGVILESDIENRVGSTDTPFVSNIVTPSVTTSELLKQWNAQWNDFLLENRADIVSVTKEIEDQIRKWYQTLTESIDDNAAVNLQIQIGSLDTLRVEAKTLTDAVNVTGFYKNSLPVFPKGINGIIKVIDDQTVNITIPTDVSDQDFVFCTFETAYGDEKFQKNRMVRPLNMVNTSVLPISTGLKTSMHLNAFHRSYILVMEQIKFRLVLYSMPLKKILK